MLLSLKIENIAVIESAGLEFGKGLNVLTGETGGRYTHNKPFNKYKR